MSELKTELEAGFKAIDDKVGVALAKHDKEVVELGRASKESRDELKALTKDHKAMHDQLVAMGDTMTELSQRATTTAESTGKQSLGQMVADSKELASFISGSTGRARATFENNTIVTGGDNSVTRHDQLSGVVGGAFTELEVMPTLQTGQTSSNIIYFSKELAWTNNAAETAENTTKPESDLTFEEVNLPVLTIPHFLKVSKQALSDSSFLSSYIDLRMSHGVRDVVESQIINGTGIGGTLSGWLATGNHTVTSPLLTTDFFGLARKMKQEIKTAKYKASYFYVNPIDWANAETLRRGSGDAAFLAASGAVNYVNNGLTPLLWGLPVVESTNVPAGTLICKSTMADMWLDRQQTVVEFFEQDADNVQTNLVTVRGEARGVEAVMVPAAIRTGDIATITAPA